MAIHHLALLVQDLARAERFYTQVLGLAVLRRWDERSVWLDLGQGAFLALERASGPRSDEGGWHMAALTIGPTERATWISRLAAAGHPIFDSTPYTIYVRDPEGNRVGLSHWPQASDALD